MSKKSKAILFSKVGCTPCVNVKKFILSETELEYIEYDVEKDSDKAEKFGIMSVPTLFIGEKRVAGFKPHEIMKMINEK